MSSILQVKGITKKFGGLTALQDVNAEIKRGKIVGMIGPNGAGKTTLFNVISGFISPDEGEVMLEEENILGLDPHEICDRGLTRTFQLVKPMGDITVLENVIVGAHNQVRDRESAEKLAKDQLKFVGLSRLEDKLANELQAAELKKLEFARVLATDPKIVLFDELMSGLNPKEIKEELNLLRKVREKGITIFLIEHIMGAIMNISDIIIVLHHGEKIAEGKPKEIKKNEKVEEAYLGGHVA